MKVERESGLPLHGVLNIEKQSEESWIACAKASSSCPNQKKSNPKSRSDWDSGSRAEESWIACAKINKVFLSRKTQIPNPVPTGIWDPVRKEAGLHKHVHFDGPRN